MASAVQGKLKKLKPTAKNVVDKFKEVLDQTLLEVQDASALKDGLEAFIAAGGCVLTSAPPVMRMWSSQSWANPKLYTV